MQTCGNGLAERASLPSKMSEVAEAMSRVVELHQRGLVLDDAHARTERDAYARLEAQFRTASELLKTIGREMSGYRDLPMGKHDMAALSTAENVGAFAGLVRVERELAEQLRESLERDEAMLAQMPRAS